MRLSLSSLRALASGVFLLPPLPPPPASGRAIFIEVHVSVVVTTAQRASMKELLEMDGIGDRWFIARIPMSWLCSPGREC